MKKKEEKKGKLVELIEALEAETNKNDWNKLKKEIVNYLESDLFKVKNKKNALNFFTFLADKKRKNAVLTDKLIFEESNNKDGRYSKVYNENTHKPTLKNLKGDLYQVLKDFLALKKYIKLQEEQEAAYEKDYFFLESLRDLKLKSLFEKDLRKIQNDYSKQTVKGVAFLLNAIRLEKMVFQKNIILENRSKKTNLETLLNRIEEYYLLLKSKYAVAGLTKEYSTSEKYDHKKLDSLKLEGLDSTFRASNNLLLKIYHELFLLYTVNDRFQNKAEVEQVKQEHYKKIFKLLIDGEKQQLSRQELRHAYTGLLVFFHQKVANWELDYLEEVFNVYKRSVETGYIFVKDDGKIDFRHFKNIANIASSLNKVAWLEKFIIENKDKVRIKSKEEAKALKEKEKNEFFSDIILTIAKKDYERAAEILKIEEEDDREEKTRRQRPIFDGFYDNADYRVFEIKVYYEKKYIYLLQNALTAFRNYLTDKTDIDEQQKVTYNNFINVVERLKNNRESKRKTIKSPAEIKKYKPIKEHIWLLEKAEELGIK